jgi:hypothetical protein
MATQTTDTKLSADDWAAVRAATEAAAGLLESSGATPEIVQEKIQRFIDDLTAGAVENPLGSDLSFALAALWASSICDAYGWEWIVPVHGNWRGLGVADRERKFLALPFNLFSKLVDDRDLEIPGSLIRFRAIGEQHLPDSAPGRYTIITS